MTSADLEPNSRSIESGFGDSKSVFKSLNLLIFDTPKQFEVGGGQRRRPPFFTNSAYTSREMGRKGKATFFLLHQY